MMHATRGALRRRAFRMEHTINSVCKRSTSAAAVTARSRDEYWGNSTVASLAVLTAVAVGAVEWRYNNNRVTQCKAAAAQNSINPENKPHDSDEDDTTTLLNWSGTHSVKVKATHLHEPESVEQVESIVRYCHEHNMRLRPLGSALSPNGLAFNEHGMISMANLDEIVDIDTQNMTVTVQAGARVRDVIEALRPHNMTLPNLASIAEQQMGGFVQVGAHGTGRTFAPVDHYVTSLTLVTPSRGKMTLTAEKDGELFHLAKVGLGLLGVVVEVTMKCVPAHKLVEHTFVLTRHEAKERLNELLAKHQHMRYMWIPYTDSVVCVTNDPEDKFIDETNAAAVVGTNSDTTFHAKNYKSFKNKYSHDDRFKPLRDLVLELYKHIPNSPFGTLKLIREYGFGELRDAILAVDPLNIEHVKRCNLAEAEFWKRNQGYQVKPSDELLQFDCGGQQWVYEVCFPTASKTKSSKWSFGNNNNSSGSDNKVVVSDGTDMKFMEELLQGIEAQGIPAHAPIEQRWTASSSSLMSPAYGNDSKENGGLHSWVGIIYYLPGGGGGGEDDFAEQERRRKITQSFRGQYCSLVRDLSIDINATSHWAKLEMPQSLWQLADLRSFMQMRFPILLFNKARYKYDPKNILSNDLLDMVLGKPTP